MFWQNMDDFIFGVMQPSGVKLYVAFLDGNHYSYYPEHRALGAEIVRKPESYINNVRLPFLQRYRDSGVIWGVDLINEPEAMIAGSMENWATWGVTWDEMRNFLKTCATAIHNYDADIKVSAGSGWHNWANIQAGRFNNLGFDFADFHYYHDAPHPAFPTAQALGVSVPVMVGECGQASATWDDTLQYNAVSQAFANAESAGYAAALSWYYNFAGSTDKHTHLNADGSWRPVMNVFASYADYPDFTAGTNLPWLSGAYRHDFGPNPEIADSVRDQVSGGITRIGVETHGRASLQMRSKILKCPMLIVFFQYNGFYSCDSQIRPLHIKQAILPPEPLVLQKFIYFSIQRPFCNLFVTFDMAS